MSLAVRLLGPLTIQRNGASIAGLRSRKALALFVYLVATEKPVTRAKLVDLIWPDQDEKRGRANLSWALNHLKKHIPGCISAERHTIQFTPSDSIAIDIHTLQLALATSDRARLETAAQRIQGDFLEGFTLDNSPDFELWVIAERERCRQLAVQAVVSLIDQHERQGDLASTIPFAEQWVQLMPWREAAHFQLIRAYVAAGQREAALAQFERCQQTLRDELGLDVSEELQTYHAILQQERPAVVLPRHNLSKPTAPLIGRDSELSALESLFEGGSRLVTLVGVGGVGKTHLASQFAWQQATAFSRYPDGLYFIPSIALNHADELARAIAQAVGITVSGSEPPTKSVHNYLREKRLLLIIDNFEQLLAATDFISDLFVESGGVSVLITSQERLQLSAETTLPLTGLTPTPEQALALFVHYAQQQDARYQPNEQDWDAISAISILLDGNPLAIQLAASWVPLLAPADLLDTIKHDISFLASDLRDLPARHRSLQAVFTHAQRHLSDSENTLLAQLAIFEGDFAFRSAVAVGGARPNTLLRLVNRSLVQRLVDGRYRLHPVIRHFAYEQLQTLPDRDVVETALSAYVGAELGGYRSGLGEAETETFAKIGREWQLIQSGWRLMISHSRWEDVSRSFHAVEHYLSVTSQSQLAIDLFGSAIDALRREPVQTTLLGQLLTRVGIMHARLAEYDAARRVLNESILVLSDGLPVDKALALMGIANVDRDQGQLDVAMTRNLEALALLERADAPWRTAVCYNQLGTTALRMRNLDSAETYYQKSLDLYRKVGSRWAMTQPINNLAIIAYFKKRSDDALRLMAQNAELYAELGDTKGQAITLGNQATMAYESGDPAAAMPLFERCLPLVQQIGDRWLLSNTLSGYGYTLAQLGQLADARGNFQHALRVAQAIDAIALHLFALNGLAQVLRLEGGAERVGNSAEIVAAILNHPDLNQPNKVKATAEKTALLEQGIADGAFEPDPQRPSLEMLSLQQLAL